MCTLCVYVNTLVHVNCADCSVVRGHVIRGALSLSLSPLPVYADAPK